MVRFKKPDDGHSYRYKKQYARAAMHESGGHSITMGPEAIQ